MPINNEAACVFEALNDWAREQAEGWFVSFEVGMAGFVNTVGDRTPLADAAFSSYNSKRVDFLLIDDRYYPRLVVEYNGTGHHLGNADDRMAVKRLVLARAGIPLLELPKLTGKAQIQKWVEERLEASAP